MNPSEEPDSPDPLVVEGSGGLEDVKVVASRVGLNRFEAGWRDIERADH